MKPIKSGAFFKGSLARRFAAYIVAGATFISLLAVFFFIFHEYFEEVYQLEETLNNAHLGVEQSLQTSLWLTNDDMLLAIMNGILNLPHIEEVIIEKEDSSSITRGQVVGNKLIVHQHPLHYSYEGKDVYLGTIQITASKDAAFSDLLREATAAIGVVFLLAALFSVLVLGLFYVLIGRYLQELTNYSKSLSADRLDRPFVLSRKVSITNNPDELHILESAINDMRGNLKKSLSALAESEQKLSLLMSNLQGMVFRCKTTASRRMEFVSDGCKTLTGYSSHQLRGSTDFTYSDIIHPEDLDAVGHTIEVAQKAEQSYQVEYRIITCEKYEKWVWEQGVFIGNTFGEVVIEGFIIDISDRKQAEESRRLYEYIVASTDDMMSFIDTQGVFRAVNDSYLNFLGKKMADVIGKPVEKIIGRQNYHRYFKPDLDKAFLGETARFERRYSGADGQEKTLNVTCYPFKDQEQNIIGVVICSTDITQLRRAEEEKDRLMSAIEQAEEVITITDVEGTIQYVNPAFTRLTGYLREEVAGTNLSILKSGKHNVTFYQKIWATLLEGKSWSGTLRNSKKDGTLFEERATISPVKDSSGQITNFVAVMRDITKEITLENQLRHAAKMEAVGTLTGGVAHDFNNILAAIIGYSEEIKENASPESQIGQDIRLVIQAGKRATDLVKQLLTFSRKTNREKQHIQPHLIVKEALNMLRASLPSTIHIEQNIIDCPLILADPINIHQVVVNLCTNAAHAMAENKGTLRVELHQEEIGSRVEPLNQDISPGKYILLSVSDTGAGIREEYLERIFEPYYTTKGLSEGTGLGLSVVHGIVSDCNGWIDVDSHLGHGSTFHVYLPVAEEVKKAPEDTPATRKNSTLVAEGKTVLLVDDEKTLVKLNTKRLQKMGFTVLGFTKSEKALEAFQKNPDAFDLLISDQTMPRLTGLELANAVLSITPSLPIIICTGHSGTVSEKRALSAGISKYLIKPVQTEDLFAAIQEVLSKNNDEEV